LFFFLVLLEKHCLPDFIQVRATDNTATVQAQFATTGVFYRTCPKCDNAMAKTIFYKRLSQIKTFNARAAMFDKWSSVDNELNHDFALYSSYEDLLADRNRWQFCDWRNGRVEMLPFPFNCNWQNGHSWPQPQGAFRVKRQSCISASCQANEMQFFILHKPVGT
jgi:hypothetical protein